MRIVILSILVSFLITSVFSQSCYNNNITDVSGINAGSLLSELESISCKLRDSIGSDFTVYEGAVYRHSSKFNEGMEPYIQKLMTEVRSISDYYLVVVKIGSELDNFERVYIKLSLPTDGNYGCISREYPNFTISFEYLIESKINSEILENSNSNKYSAILKGLELMSEKLTSKKLCCLTANRSNSCSECEIPKPQVLSDLAINQFILHPDSVQVSMGNTSTYPYVYSNLNFTFDSLSQDQLVSDFLSNAAFIGDALPPYKLDFF